MLNDLMNITKFFIKAFISFLSSLSSASILSKSALYFWIKYALSQRSNAAIS